MIVLPTDEEAKKLKRCLQSVAPHVDKIHITQAGKEPNEAITALCKRYGATTDFFEWINDFAAARTHNFAQLDTDWILWLDADDVLENGDQLRSYTALAEKHNIDGYGMLYHYGFDENGNCTEKHWKTQFIRHDGHAEWKGAIHEDLTPKRAVNWTKINTITRIHRSTKSEHADHFERNLAILESETKRDPKEPRNWFYLARTLLGLGRFNECINAVANYLELSGWDQERYEARMIAGEAFMQVGDTKSALDAFQAAILEYESAPDAYIYKARCYVQQERWSEALINLEIAGSLKGKGAVVENPMLLSHDLPILAGMCLLNLRRFEEARRMFFKTRERHDTSRLHELCSISKKMADDEELTLSYYNLGKRLFDEGSNEAVNQLLNTVPSDIADDPRLLKLRFSTSEPFNWADKSIVFYCGNTTEAWDGESMNKGGIGGSETAVIHLATRFAKAGYTVTVFNRCDAPADGVIIDGVTYRNYWQINRLDTFDTLILWRTPAYLDAQWNANRIIVDMHDVSGNDEFTPKRIAAVDSVFVKSNYHKSLYPNVPDEKFVVVGNGIDLARFEGDKTKDVNRFVYTSTPDRGLEYVLDMWPRIKDELPDAELHIYYGWNTFAAFNQDNPTALEWMAEMKEKMQQPGIANHGRVPQDQLAKDLMISSLWLYPTDFPEIHCITALEMQAAGVFPITTGYAALEETQQSGIQFEGDPRDPDYQSKYIELVVSAAKNGVPQAEIEKGYEYAHSCSWDAVAEKWLATIKA